MALRSRPVGQTAAKDMGPREHTELVNVATLLRGRVYFFKDERFEVGQSKVISDELADVLEELHDEVKDRDGEFLEKPFFMIQRGVPRPREAPEPTRLRKATRLPARLPAQVAR